MKKIKKYAFVLSLFFLNPHRLLWLYGNTEHSSIINKVVRWKLRRYTISISEGAIISDKTIFPHPQGIVIGRGVIIKNHVTIYQGVTIGVKDGSKLISERDIYNKYPTLEKGVTIYTNSIIVGGITIGENSIIGASLFIDESIAPDSKVVGIREYQKIRN